MTESPVVEDSDRETRVQPRSAILLLSFNRPECTARVIEVLRANRVPKLYFATDGPRVTHPSDVGKCAAVRALVETIDWPCEVKTMFAEHNRGCRLGVQSAMDWFFSNESEGIILEDDVLPQGGFFRYCDELLARYRDDARVCAISGSNLEGVHRQPPDSYRFSRYTLVWGWATWRRAWRRYDPAVPQRGVALPVDLSQILPDWRERVSWKASFEAMAARKIDSWALLWTLSQWRDATYCILPTVNHTTNIGFDDTGTHTGSMPPYVRDSPSVPLSFPLRHPPQVAPDQRAEETLARRVYSRGLVAIALSVVKRPLGVFHVARPRS